MEEHKTGRWTTGELNILNELYGKIDIETLVSKLNRSKASIHLKANRSGLKYQEKYIYNQDYFEHIDNPEKAYWLGFIYADGCVIYNKERRNYEFTIQLQAGDIAHLIKLNESLQGNVVPTKHINKTGFPGRDEIEHEQCRIRYYSSKMVLDLIDKGVLQSKTYKMNFPTFLNDELLWHFVRGFMDGDGYICVPKSDSRYGYRVGFTCYRKCFLEGLQSFLQPYFIKSYINKDKDSYKLEIRNRNSVYMFLKECYKNANIYLDRKYSKYLISNDLLSQLEIAG